MTRWRNSFYVKEIALSPKLPWSLVIRIKTAHHIDYLQKIYIKNLSVMFFICLVGLLLDSSIIRLISYPLKGLAEVTNNLPDKIFNQQEEEALPNMKINHFFQLNNNFSLRRKILKA